MLRDILVGGCESNLDDTFYKITVKGTSDNGKYEMTTISANDNDRYK